MPERTAAIGMARRGKYTFVMMVEPRTRLVEAWASPLAKKFQGTRAA